MRTQYITKGDTINTMAGYEVVKGYNGSIVDTDSYEIGEDGEPEKVGERRLTLEEIGHIMREVDGLNHKVFYEERQ